MLPPTKSNNVHRKTPQQPPTQKNPTNNNSTCTWSFILGWYNIPSVFNTTLAPILSKPPLAIKQLIIACTNPPNLRGDASPKPSYKKAKGNTAQLHTATTKPLTAPTSQQ
jgi:hypothetical protein